MKKKSDKLAFVLSGGVSLGATQVGCLEALLEEGVSPDLIVGTSVGAINGAWLAKYPNLHGVAQLKNMWISDKYGGILSDSRAKQLLRLFIGRNYISTNKLLRKSLCRYLHCYTTFEELAIPLHVTVADLQTGKQKVFSKGHLMPAILVSTAIPGVLEPVVIDDATYVDGAIINNCSIETAWSAGATTIVAIECPRPRPGKGYGVLDVFKQAAWVSLDRLCHLERERFEERCNLVVLEPEIGRLERFEINDFSNTGRFIEASKGWTKKFLRKLDLKVLRNLTRRRKSASATIMPDVVNSRDVVKTWERSYSDCKIPGKRCRWYQWCGECGK